MKKCLGVAPEFRLPKPDDFRIFYMRVLDFSLDVNSCYLENIEKDLFDYINFRVTNSANIQSNLVTGAAGQFRFCQHLLSLSKGSFLFAKLTLDLFENGRLVAKSTSFKVLPVSLAQIYQLHLNLKFPTASAFQKVSSHYGQFWFHRFQKLKKFCRYGARKFRVTSCSEKFGHAPFLVEKLIGWGYKNVRVFTKLSKLIYSFSWKKYSYFDFHLNLLFYEQIIGIIFQEIITDWQKIFLKLA